MTTLTYDEAIKTTSTLYEWLTKYVDHEHNAEIRRVTYPILEEAYRVFHLMWEGATRDLETAEIAWIAVFVLSGTTRVARALELAVTPARSKIGLDDKVPITAAMPDYFVNLTLDQLLEYEREARE
jgi:hypothetical protein